MSAVVLKNEEKQLREALSRTFLEAHPNLERRGCPGPAILKAMASDKITLEEAVPWVHHLSSCSPCSREFSGFRKAHRRRQRMELSAVAAVVLLITSVGMWFFVKNSRGTYPLQPSTLDLSGWAAVRGPEENPLNPPPQLQRGYLDLTIDLPNGSEPGVYDVKIIRESGSPLWSAHGEAKLENYRVTLRLRADLRNVNPGWYFLAFRPRDRSWTQIPLVVK